MKFLVLAVLCAALISCGTSPENKACKECGSWNAVVHTEGAPDSLVLSEGGYFKFYYISGGVPFDSLTGKYQIDTAQNTFRTYNYAAQNVFAIEALDAEHFTFTDSTGHRFNFLKDVGTGSEDGKGHAN